MYTTMNEAETRIVQARVKLLFQHPFFGQLAIRLTLEQADEVIKSFERNAKPCDFELPEYNKLQ